MTSNTDIGAKRGAKKQKQPRKLLAKPIANKPTSPVLDLTNRGSNSPNDELPAQLVQHSKPNALFPQEQIVLYSVTMAHLKAVILSRNKNTV